jgi:hypothetical protein
MSFFDAPSEQVDNAQAPTSEAAAPAAPATDKPTEATEPNPAALQSEAVLAPEIENTDPPEPEDAELEYEGKKFKVPKDLEGELKNALLRHGDYTRKTQDVAAERESLKAERAAHQEQVKVHQALSQEIAQITAVDQRLQYLQSINLQALSAQDAQQAQNLLIELNQLQARRGQLITSATQKQQQLQSAQQQEIATQTDKARAFLMREFKDWSPEKDRALEAYAQREGIDTRALGQFLIQNPQIARVLDKAAKWDQAAKQRAAAKPKPPEPPKPVTRIGGAAASNTKSPSDMSPAEYAVWRRERNQKR